MILRYPASHDATPVGGSGYARTPSPRPGLDVDHPPLRALHPEGSLSKTKLGTLRRLPTSTLVASLQPGTPAGLKTRPDGTILDGHHRILVLRERGIDVDALPRYVSSRGADED